MSAESMIWLNTRQKVGFGHIAWWFDPDMEDASMPSHYADAIPVLDIERDLFGWTPREGTVAAEVVIQTPESMGDGFEPVRFTVTDPDRKSIVRPPGSLGESDKGAILGVFKSGYKIHGYMEWLVRNVELITSGSSLGIASAGLLRGGAQAYTSFSMPEVQTTAEGIDFRPYLGACTSLDGTLASDYFRCVQLPVCDNTLAIARAEGGGRIKYKHTRNSVSKIGDAREALGIVESIVDDFTAQTDEQSNTAVTDEQFGNIIRATPTTNGKTLADALDGDDGRGRTMAETRQSELLRLWNSDPRVAPWTGTMFGVVQAFNTYEHHCKAVRGGGDDEDAKRAVRMERNMERVLRGELEAFDFGTVKLAESILTPA